MASGYGNSSWANSVIYILVAICLAFIIITYYRIIKRRCLSFNGASFFQLRPPLIETNQNETLLHQSTGLASAVIHSLPAIQFREASKEGGSHGNTDCAVCLGEFHEGEWLRLLPNCAHVFHVSCIDTWFHTHSTCPLCRANVLYDFGDYNSSVSIVALLEALPREDTSQERPLGYHLLESQMMQHPEFRLGTRTGCLFESDSDDSFPGMFSPIIGAPNNQQTAETLLKLAHSYKGECSSRVADFGDQYSQDLNARAELPHWLLQGSAHSLMSRLTDTLSCYTFAKPSVL